MKLRTTTIIIGIFVGSKTHTATLFLPKLPK
jgi:hypothetical protein